MIQYVINEKFNKMSVRDFLEYFKISQKKINWIVNDKLYLVNGTYSEILNTNDVLTFHDECFKESLVEPIYRNIEVLYQDEHILVVDKPKNLIIYGEGRLEI